jgi:hypothetical protein
MSLVPLAEHASQAKEGCNVRHPDFGNGVITLVEKTSFTPRFPASERGPFGEKAQSPPLRSRTGRLPSAPSSGTASQSWSSLGMCRG